MVKRPDRNAREQRQLRRDYEARQAVHAARVKRKLRDNWIVGIVAILVCGGAIFAQYAYFSWGPGLPAPSATETPSAGDTPEATPGTLTVPDPSDAQSRVWTGTMTINGIALGVSFDGVNAPQATAVMVQASETGWYDGKFCPRLTTSTGFSLLQCGTDDPSSTASESGYAFGPIENSPADGVYPAGSIAMARQSGNADSMAHQFFIVTADSSIPSDSAGGYTIVGQVTSGLDQLIAGVASQGTSDGSQDGTPKSTVTIQDFSIQ